MIPLIPSTSRPSILLRMLVPVVLLGIATAALLLVGPEHAFAQDGGAPANAQDGGEQSEGYAERLAARIERYQNALAGDAASDQAVAGTSSAQSGSGEITGLASEIEKGKSDTFTVTARGLDPDYYYEYIFQIGAREKDAKTPAHGDIGFDDKCRSIIESIVIPRRAEKRLSK